MNGNGPSVPTPAPPRPHGKLPAGSIWPPEHGRLLLRALAGETPRRADELVGRQGRQEGSGSSDLIVERIGDCCFKTSPRRRFADEDTGRRVALEIAQAKQLLGDLLPPDSTLALVREDEGTAVWLWSVSRWLTTCRGALEEHAANGDESALARELVAFGEVALRALELALRRNLLLDVHPSNFGWWEGTLRYLDDDLARGERLPAIGHVMLQRIEEYAAFPRATGAYVEHLVTLLPGRLSAGEVERADLRRIFELEPARSEAASQARRRLLSALWRCR